MNLLELLTREAEIAKSQQKQQKKGASDGVNKGGIKIHPDTANEPFHPLGNYSLVIIYSSLISFLLKNMK